jgi:aryl-alcohol dehydrogenase-like predicted oxidoreductase
MIESRWYSPKDQVMPNQPARRITILDNIELGLGTRSWGDRFFWHYGQDFNDDDIAAAFRTCLAAGIKFIDTAEVYGSGRSEYLLGRLIKEIGQTVIVASKFFPLPYRFTKKSVLRGLRGSLERLGLEQVDLYQLHWPSLLVPNDIYVEGLAKIVQEGLTRTVGVSNYDLKKMQQAQNILARHGIPLASNQVEYHLLNRTVEKNGLLDQCKLMGVRLIAYSPLALGLLTGKYTVETPPPGQRGKKFAALLKDIPPLIALLTEIGKGHDGKTPGQVAINWVICKGALPIPGSKTAEQAKQNVGATGWRLTPEEIQALDGASDKLV